MQIRFGGEGEALTRSETRHSPLEDVDAIEWESGKRGRKLEVPLAWMTKRCS